MPELEKVKCSTPDLAVENAKKLLALFPECEGQKGEVDIDKLRQVLSSTAIEGNVERYEFTWPGKRAAKAAASASTSKTLRPCAAESVGKDGTPGGFDSENLYIEGDNLEVLKLLQTSYANQVKMIYIDPPYNTGHDFVYRDRFSLTQKEIESEAGAFDEDGNRFEVNDSAEARYHSNWCSMMYPRLKLARNLLCDDGIIFISIDDNEVTNARKLCDEIFGEANFRNEIIVRRGAKSVQAQFETWDKLGRDFEYVLLYTKRSDYRFPQQKRILEETKSGSWNNHWRGTDRPTMRYEIFGITPSSGQWRWSKDRSDKAIENYARLISEMGENPTDEQIDEWYQKQGGDIDLLRLSSTGKPEHYIAPTNSTLLNSSWMDLMVTSSSELTALFGEKVFDMPKSPEVIKRMLGFATKDAVVLDFFSGSGSTAHAIMDANAEDGGTRKFIMVQLPEPCAEDSEAVKAGYKTICEIGKERIRRAGKKIKEENAEEAQSLDIGFRVLKIDSSSLDDTSQTVNEIDQLALKYSRLKTDRSADDFLFQVLLETRLPLSEPISKAEVAGNEVFFVGGTGTGAPLVACLDAKAKMTTEFFLEIAKLKPGLAFFRDDAFADDSARTNLQQAFDQFSPSTSIKVI